MFFSDAWSGECFTEEWVSFHLSFLTDFDLLVGVWGVPGISSIYQNALHKHPFQSISIHFNQSKPSIHFDDVQIV